MAETRKPSGGPDPALPPIRKRNGTCFRNNLIFNFKWDWAHWIAGDELVGLSAYWVEFLSGS